MWHIPFALTGQHWDAPSASLSFHPKISAPFSLPVFVPGTVLLLNSQTSGEGTLTLIAGRSLTLKELVVGNTSAATQLPKTFDVGDTIKW